ncbi:MAG TPA: M15 family metallopeptidase, partial [Gemmatimonadaceae bacterium]|nr:M15 family metallopeptidase [Gemmatimonadaceae bacterium]
MIQSVGARAMGAPESTGPRATHDDDAPASFAGILAGVMNAGPRPQAAEKPKGTSELDAKGDEDAPDGTASSNESANKTTNDAKATTAAATSSATDIVRSIAALDPQLQAKLARVIQRVQDETGHTVQVAETYRSQTRQNALYEQGRETTGPVVTWTLNSKHTQGRAVDVVLDGGSAGPDAYAALQRIAREEGLRTLGARDPGHLELPGNAPAAANASALIPTAPADATGAGQVPITNLAKLAQIAQVAVDSTPAPSPRVARVAQVASVATVANVAQPARVAGVSAVSMTSGG